MEGLALAWWPRKWAEERAAPPTSTSTTHTPSPIYWHRVTALQSLGQGEVERRVWTAAGEAVGCGLLGKNKHQRHLPFPHYSESFPCVAHGRDTPSWETPLILYIQVFFLFPDKTRREFPRPLHLPYTASYPCRLKNCLRISHPPLSYMTRAFIQRSQVFVTSKGVEEVRQFLMTELQHSLPCAFWEVPDFWSSGDLGPLSSVLCILGPLAGPSVQAEASIDSNHNRATSCGVPSPLLFANCHNNLPARSHSALYKCPQMNVSKLQCDPLRVCKALSGGTSIGCICRGNRRQREELCLLTCPSKKSSCCLLLIETQWNCQSNNKPL